MIHWDARTEKYDFYIIYKLGAHSPKQYIYFSNKTKSEKRKIAKAAKVEKWIYSSDIENEYWLPI